MSSLPVPIQSINRIQKMLRTSTYTTTCFAQIKSSPGKEVPPSPDMYGTRGIKSSKSIYFPDVTIQPLEEVGAKYEYVTWLYKYAISANAQ